MTAPRRRLLVATGSAHKLIELQRLFGDLPIDLVTLRDLGITDEAPEDGTTFEANALQKARWYAEASSEWTLADDSGLEVAALKGAPGVYTRRYAGPDATDVQNYEKLLAETAGVTDRSARFVCTMALIDPVNGSERTFRGECPGTLTTAPRGEFGFGYDPIFEVDGRTMAERAPAEKDALSHRGRAAALVAAALRSELEQTR
ncbi:MAG: RdgB/HAM1 family non-canonical purine NTP pyrophosphatase [Chloroflexi bacterium]|nr:RdgB/HAM1 family non-canonical purine NTP pyrophosphatase [Chloroflexota bacterium]